MQLSEPGLKRCLFAGLLAAFLLGVAAFIAYLTVPRPGITERNIDRIAVGMTLQEVQTLLGDRPAKIDIFADDGSDTRLARWIGRDIEVLIDLQGNPLRVVSTQKEVVEQSFFDRWFAWWPW